MYCLSYDAFTKYHPKVPNRCFIFPFIVTLVVHGRSFGQGFKIHTALCRSVGAMATTNARILQDHATNICQTLKRDTSILQHFLIVLIDNF